MSNIQQDLEKLKNTLKINRIVFIIIIVILVVALILLVGVPLFFCPTTYGSMLTLAFTRGNCLYVPIADNRPRPEPFINTNFRNVSPVNLRQINGNTDMQDNSQMMNPMMNQMMNQDHINNQQKNPVCHGNNIEEGQIFKIVNYMHPDLTWIGLYAYVDEKNSFSNILFTRNSNDASQFVYRNKVLYYNDSKVITRTPYNKVVIKTVKEVSKWSKSKKEKFLYWKIKDGVISDFYEERVLTILSFVYVKEGNKSREYYASMLPIQDMKELECSWYFF